MIDAKDRYGFLTLPLDRPMAVPVRTLTVSTGTFDRLNTFRIRGLDGRVSLMRGYATKDDGVYWGLLHASVLAGRYSDEEIAEHDRLLVERAIEHGERVLIEGKRYTVCLLGRYSDCARFEPVEGGV